jgi:outer membrane receptor protein involved in Fe transport
MKSTRRTPAARFAPPFFAVALAAVATALTGSLAFATTDGAPSAAGTPPAATSPADAAEVAPASPAETFFDATTVTALGHDAKVFDIATPVTVIQRPEIERRLVSQPTDLLRDQPGVDVNGVGANQVRPVIRGQRGLRVLFLADGLRMNNARRQTDFGEITGLIDLGDVEALEVVRGPSSVLYGSDAIGGVLNLVTRDTPSTEGLQGSLEARYGSAEDLVRGALSLAGRRDRFGWRLGASHRESDDYEAPSGRYGDVRLAGDTPVLDTGLDDDSLDLGLEFTLGAAQSLRLKGHRYRADQTGFGLVEPSLLEDRPATRARILYPFQDFDRYQAAWNLARSSALLDSADVRLFWQSNERALVNDIQINIGPVGPGFPDSSVLAFTDNFTDLETTGLRAELMKDLAGRHLVTYGLDCTRDDSFNTDSSVITSVIRFPFPPFQAVDEERSARANAPNADHDSCGLFAQDEIALGGRAKVTAGLRWQRVETTARPTAGWDTSDLDFGDDQTVGALNATFALRDDLNLFASAATAFRAPNLVERLFSGPTPEGSGFQILNRDLTSETGENYDLGLKWRRERASVEAVAFRSELDEGIVQHFLSAAEIAALPQALRDQINQVRPQFVVQQRNIDRLRYQGIELTAAVRLPADLVLGGSFTHLSADRIDSANPPTGDTYADKTTAYVQWRPAEHPYWAEYRVRHNGSEDTNLEAGEPVPAIGETLPSFTVHSVAGGVTLGPWAGLTHTVLLEVSNATDELYAEFSNAVFFRPEPGRRVSAAYRLRF